MKKVCKIVLLLLTIICYGTTVFEWDENESAKNYQNECHLYLTEQRTNVDFEVNSVIPSEYKNDFTEDQETIIDCPKIKVLFSSLYMQKKHDKIFLRNRALLI